MRARTKSIDSTFPLVSFWLDSYLPARLLHKVSQYKTHTVVASAAGAITDFNTLFGLWVNVVLFIGFVHREVALFSIQLWFVLWIWCAPLFGCEDALWFLLLFVFRWFE